MSFTNRTLLHILTRDGVLKPGRALDLGCGIGRDAEILSKNNFIVDAVDADTQVVAKIPTFPSITPIVSKLEDYTILENTYNLVSSQYVLHFLPKETAHEIITRMVAGAIPGGIISFNLLGEKDEWRDKWTTWTREEAESFISTLPIITHKIITEEGKGMTRAGIMKYWHVLNFVLIKR